LGKEKKKGKKERSKKNKKQSLTRPRCPAQFRLKSKSVRLEHGTWKWKPKYNENVRLDSLTLSYLAWPLAQKTGFHSMKGKLYLLL